MDSSANAAKVESIAEALRVYRGASPVTSYEWGTVKKTCTDVITVALFESIEAIKQNFNQNFENNFSSLMEIIKK